MSYDIYHNWKADSPGSMDILKVRVLEDLKKAGDETERLEVLDSFQAVVERVHTAELGEHLAKQIMIIARPFLVTAIQGKLPESHPMARPRVVRQP
jgi:hypothetical protein